MTLHEMKLAVVGKLPGLVELESTGYFYWKNNTDLHEFRTGVYWLTDGLQVCHEAEKLLSGPQIIDYVRKLCWATLDEDCDGEYGCHRISFVVKATYEQRLEALSRIWWPERFK